MPDIRVQFANPEHLEACMELENIPLRRVIVAKIQAQDVVIALWNHEVAGYLRLEYLWGKVPLIGLIRVREERQKQGLGRCLLSFTCKHLQSQGHTFLLSSSSAHEPEPQTWHRQQGFRECGILLGVNERGQSEIFFRRPL